MVSIASPWIHTHLANMLERPIGQKFRDQKI